MLYASTISRLFLKMTISPFLFMLLNSECLSKSFPLGLSKVSYHNKLLFRINKH